jgi:AsmA-like C-terminal region
MSQSHAAVVEQPPPQQNGLSYQRRRRWLAITGVVLLTLAIAGAIVLAHYWPFSRERVSGALQDDFHGAVTFTRFHSTIFPHPGCVAEGATLIHAGAPADSLPFASAQKLVIRAHYLDFLLRPGYISHIDVEGLQIHIPPRGSTAEQPNQSPSSTRVGEVVANNALLEVARKTAQPLRFEIHSLTLKSVSRKDGFNYNVVFLNAIPPGEIQSRGHFGPWNTADPGQTPVTGTYKFEHAFLGVFDGIDGLLTSHDNFHGTLAQVEAHGSVEIPDFKVRRAARSAPIETKYDSFVDALNGDVRLEHVESTIVKTNVLVRGSVAGTPGRHGKVTSLDLNVNKGRIQDILRLFIKEPRSPIAGAISFRAHATVPPEGRPFEQEVVLVGDFGIDEGRFTKPKTQKEVDNLSERARGEKVDDKDKENEKGDDDDDSSRAIADLRGHVELRNGVATLKNISFSVPGAVAYMHGTFNLLNQRIDFHGVLKTDAEFSKVGGGGIKSIFLKPFDAIFKGKPKGAEIPVKLTGTYSHPEPGLEITGGKKDEKKGEKKK